MLPVPRSFAELTPAWATAALGRRCPGAVVAAVAVEGVGEGTNRRGSIRLAYEAGSGPERLFVKTHGRLVHRLALVALRALTAEARLVASGVDLPLAHPLPYAAGIDRARLATVVVTEDVTAAGGRPNEATRPLGVDEVAAGLASLAGLHARYFDGRLPAPLGFLRPWRLGASWAAVSRASLARGLRRLEAAGNLLGLPGRIGAAALERQFRHSALLAASGPQTVLHGDPHPGNTYALPGGRTGFYDWQLVRTGHWSHDVGYFLAGSCSVEDRRAHEADLLAGYLEALRQAGAPAPAFGVAWARYRATPAFGLATWLHTLAAGSFQPDEVCLATLARFAAAYEDLETDRSLASPP